VNKVTLDDFKQIIEETPEEGLKRCPSCDKKIPKSCVGCLFCGAILEPKLIKLYEEQRGKKFEQ
jgi:hypothetical protein